MPRMKFNTSAKEVPEVNDLPLPVLEAYDAICPLLEIGNLYDNNRAKSVALQAILYDVYLKGKKHDDSN